MTDDEIEKLRKRVVELEKQLKEAKGETEDRKYGLQKLQVINILCGKDRPKGGGGAPAKWLNLRDLVGRMYELQSGNVEALVISFATQHGLREDTIKTKYLETLIKLGAIETYIDSHNVEVWKWIFGEEK